LLAWGVLYRFFFYLVLRFYSNNQRKWSFLLLLLLLLLFPFAFCFCFNVCLKL
jgi:hypothetical protein